MTVLFQTTLAELQKALTLTAFSASTEATRYYLNGVYVHRDGESIVFVSTDGHRMSRYSMPCEGEAFDPFIMPNDAVKKILAIKQDKNSPLAQAHLTLESGGSISFHTAGTILNFTPIDRTFPDYTCVLTPADKYSNTHISPPDHAISLLYLGDVGNAVKKALKTKAVHAQILYQEDSRGPADIRFTHGELTGFRHIIMPARV